MLSSTAAGKHLRVAVLLSGTGTSFENLCEHIDTGVVPAEVVVVLSSKTDATGLEKARWRGIPALAVPRKDFANNAHFNDALHAALEPHAVELVLLLGFLSLFEPRAKYAGRVINLHPALIPAFCGPGCYGRRVHESVLRTGVKITGASVHFADEQYDHGPIILQEAVPVLDDDTPESLAARVQAAERRLLPQAVRLFAEGRLVVEGRHVRILGAR